MYFIYFMFDSTKIKFGFYTVRNKQTKKLSKACKEERPCLITSILGVGGREEGGGGGEEGDGSYPIWRFVMRREIAVEWIWGLYIQAWSGCSGPSRI
jgi:hypothetical protein